MAGGVRGPAARIGIARGWDAGVGVGILVRVVVASSRGVAKRARTHAVGGTVPQTVLPHVAKRGAALGAIASLRRPASPCCHRGHLAATAFAACAIAVHTVVPGAVLSPPGHEPLSRASTGERERSISAGLHAPVKSPTAPACVCVCVRVCGDACVRVCPLVRRLGVAGVGTGWSDCWHDTIPVHGQRRFREGLDTGEAVLPEKITCLPDVIFVWRILIFRVVNVRSKMLYVCNLDAPPPDLILLSRVCHSSCKVYFDWKKLHENSKRECHPAC